MSIMQFIPTRFWVTKGKGESDVSSLVAFDKVLIDAGIGHQNHILVSSVPPSIEIKPEIDHIRGITHVPVKNKKKILPPSSNVHVIRAKRLGTKGEINSASIALAKVIMDIDNRDSDFFLAYEKPGHDSEETIKAAKKGVSALVENRNAYLDKRWNDNGFKIVTETLEITKKYGACAVFVVFDPFTYKQRSE